MTAKISDRPSRDVIPGGFEDLTNELSDFALSPFVRQITGGIHVNDALIHDSWGALPPEWTAYWDALPDHRLAQRELIDSIGEEPPSISSDADTASIPSSPASLVAWLGKLKAVSLPRAQRHGPVLTLPESLTSPMKTKKINEVSVAAAYIHQACESNEITHVIDMGSGQGYLSVTLAFLFPSLRILAIDGSDSQVAGSQALAASLGIPEGDRLTHLVRYIDGSAPLAAELAAWAAGQKCMLVGLHACGRLLEHMLRYFERCAFITRLGAVGCCYNHIVPRSAQCPGGFPISERLRGRGVTLSATALMTGCQAPNNWARSDLGANVQGSSSVYARKQFYRAVVEKLFYDKGIIMATNNNNNNNNNNNKTGGGAMEDRRNWGIRKGDLATFEKFTRRAMHCLGVDQYRVSAEDIKEYEARYQGYEGKIAILWTLSVLCCKAVESVIALDRYWFLVEKGFAGVDVVPIFDYEISPRNLMIIAERK